MDFHRQAAPDAVMHRVSTEGADHPVADDFTLGEFQCNDGTDVLLLHPALVELLQKVRSQYDAPTRINSGFRTHAYNQKINGAARSKHLLGMAADIAVLNVAPDEVADFAQRELQPGGLGRYDSFVHIDVYGFDRRWDFR